MVPCRHIGVETMLNDVDGAQSFWSELYSPQCFVVTYASLEADPIERMNPNPQLASAKPHD